VTDRTAGRATPEGTRRFADRFADWPGHFRAPDGVWLSSIGLGMRGESFDPGDDLLLRGAVAAALDGGLNLFDTSISYRSQRSERGLGAALARAFRSGAAARDEVFVVTKGGTLTVDPELVRGPGEARRYLIETYLETGLVDPERLVGGAHSLEPAFLLDQIERSRRNLGLETIDLYAIEEPELHLLACGPDDFRKRLAEAFAALERAVRDGKIAAYGLATWTGLLLPHTERGHLSLAEVLEMALDTGGADHHLRGLHLPYGLGMAEGLGLDSQVGPAGTGALLELVRDTGTAVFACAPLARGRAVRGFPDFVRDALPGLRTDAQRAIQFARSSPGITSALVGMRRPAHLEENLEVTRVPPAPADAIARLFADAREKN
jgi:aryl-alcohol dehydrogenase-like predicted oxidoreductase